MQSHHPTLINTLATKRTHSSSPRLGGAHHDARTLLVNRKANAPFSHIPLVTAAAATTRRVSPWLLCLVRRVRTRATTLANTTNICSAAATRRSVVVHRANARNAIERCRPKADRSCVLCVHIFFVCNFVIANKRDLSRILSSVVVLLRFANRQYFCVAVYRKKIS